ncbi:MAG: sulfatase-like hydrolase/transferase [Kiritimatiellaeota bacterium]|nr:sulfatase-like hydrolase/transferase [Kiritimatiellota bacterium]
MQGGKTSPTNIIVILTDDQGVWAAGCYGNPEIRTPNLDRLAAGGMRFESFFVATPVCSPSRATLLTGRIPSQHGVHDWLRGGNVDPGAIRYLDGEVAYTDVLAANGWNCGISGKWHMGDSQRPQHGFSHWFVHQRGGGPYMNPPMVVDGRLVEIPGYVTNIITEDALRFLDSAARGGPFYLSVHYTAPHSPWGRAQHLPEVFDSYADCPFESCPQEPRHPWAIGLTDKCLNNREMLQGYFAAVTAMDADVGRILDKVDELGLRESTLIVFLSDNGFSCGHRGFWGKGNGTNPLNMYERSIRVPAIFSQPGRISAGTVAGAMVSAYDFLPTLLDYVGLPLPENRDLPGHSFLPVLEGRDNTERDQVVVFDEYGAVRMIRTPEWKYVHRYPSGPHELFNLIRDPEECENRVEESGLQSLVGDLRARLDEWFRRYVIPHRDGRRFPVDGGGQDRRVGAS